MAGLEEILGRLLVPDNTVIQQATRELQSVYRDPSIIPVLSDLLLGSPNPQIRQFAAVLLRKRLVKVWTKLAPDLCERIKATLLQCLLQEKVHLVLLSTAHLVSMIARHELGLGKWNELSEFIMRHCNSPEPMHREIGMLMLSSLMDIATIQLQPQFPSLLQLFSSALEDTGSRMVPFYALKSLTAMVEYIKTDDVPLFRALIPKVMAVIRALIGQDEDKACEAMELFDELVECDMGIMASHLSPLIQLCLEVSSNTTLGSNIRVKALSFISWLITIKKKTLLKHGLLPSILTTMLSIMATPTEEEEEGVEDSAQSQSPISLAAQVLDVLALHLPPEKIFAPVLELIQPWVQSANQFQRAAVLIAIAVIAEGCSDHIRNNSHLPALLQVIYKGISDEQRVVRNAALFAVGQFSEHLQPEISQYSADLLPVLFQFVDFAIQSPQEESSGLTKIFYAMETFCEQLGVGLLPYLPTLMDKLFVALTAAKNVHIQELAISALGAAANACMENMLPYFPRIIDILKRYLSMPYNQELSMLQAQAIDTLGTLAKTIGQEHFLPLAQECTLLGMNLMQSSDPDIRRSVYGMLASVSGVLREAMAAHLNIIVGKMIESLVSDEGLTVHYTASQVPFLDFNEGEGEEEEGGMNESLEDDGEIEGFSVENAYLEEKEDTCNALGEIAENVGSHFLPFMDDCFREINILTEHSNEEIRKASIYALGRLCKVWYLCLANSNTQEKSELEGLINSTLVSLAATVRTDSERSVVIATLETLEDFLKSIKALSFPLATKALESLVVSVQDILEQKAQCQGESEEDESSHGDEMAEYDGMLVEYAGSIIGPLASVVGGEAFFPWLQFLIPPLMTKLKTNSTVSYRSFAIGTLAEIVEGIGRHACQLPDLYLLFRNSLGDQEDEVCSNAVYGLGLLAANALPNMNSHYAEILQSLFTVAQTRKHNRIQDNVCGAVCRMVMANGEAVPLDQVLPLLIHGLPLKEDMEENSTVYSCILHLFENKNPFIMAHIQPMLRVIAAELLPTSRLSKELKLQLVSLLHALNSQCHDQMQAAVTGLSQEQLAVLNTAIQQTTSTA